MKKVLPFFILLLTTVTFAQETKTFNQDTNKNHEVKLNGLSLIGFKWLDVSYEYLINDESSIGTSLLFSFSGNDDEVLDLYKTFSSTTYYRHFFSENYARGFFVEAFGMINTFKNDFFVEYDQHGNRIDVNDSTKTDVALGISVGGKFVTKRGFTTEIYLGLGRNMISADHFREVVGRAGISLGYRF